MKSYPIQSRESRSWERNAERQRRAQVGNVKVISLKAAESPSLRVAYAKKKQRIRRRRLRAARRVAAVLAAILLLVAIICKIMAAEEPVEVPVEEIQQETEAKELPHKATEPERVQQEPIEETRSGSGNSRNEYLLARLAMAEAEGESIEGLDLTVQRLEASKTRPTLADRGNMPWR